MRDNRPRHRRYFAVTPVTTADDILDIADGARDIRDIRPAPRKAHDRF